MGRPDVDYGDLPPDAIPDPHAECKACLEAPEDPGPGCATAYATCMADRKCKSISDCAFELDCWKLPMQGEITICALECFFKEMVFDPADPIAMVLNPVAACVLGVCQPVCGMMP